MGRCGWCGVTLRWWQLDYCRVCYHYMNLDRPSPPCAEASRWHAEPDGLPWKQKRARKLSVVEKNW